MHTPAFPDVPTKEPAEEGQPETKKIKTSHETSDKQDVVEEQVKEVATEQFKDPAKDEATNA